MSTVQQILAEKGTAVRTITPSASLLDAIDQMNQYRIGCLVVTTANGHVIGIVSERDVLKCVAGMPRDWCEASVGEVMTTHVVVCHPEDPLNTIRSLMKQLWLRQIPVVDDQGTLLGIVSIGDANAQLLVEEEVEIKYLHDYVQGRVR